MKEERYLVTVINKDDSVFTYGVTTVGGRNNAMDKVRGIKKSINEEYFIHARLSDEKADYEIQKEQGITIPSWVIDLL